MSLIFSPLSRLTCVCVWCAFSLARSHSLFLSLTHTQLSTSLCVPGSAVLLHCVDSLLLLPFYNYVSPLFFLSLLSSLSLSLSFSSYFVNSPWSIFYLPLPNTCNHSFFFFLSLYFISSLISLYIFAPIFASFLSVYPFLTSALF